MATTTPQFVDTSGKPAVVRSFCAFLDILGFRATMEDADRTEALQALLDRFLAATARPMKAAIDAAAYVGAWRVQVFSDSLLFGIPLVIHDEAAFGMAEEELCAYQYQLACAGFFTRGAFCVGPLYMDDRVAFGPAFIQAYDTERTAARDPRVVLSDGVRTLVESHLEYYAEPRNSPQNRVLLVDSDDRLFLNYLSQAVFEGAIDEEGLMSHKRHVEGALIAQAHDSHVWSKYLWLASYHNHFVGELSLGQRFDISLNSEPIRFRPLVAEGI